MQRCRRGLALTAGAAVTSCKRTQDVCFTFISYASVWGSRNALTVRHKLYWIMTHPLTVKLTPQQVLSLYVHTLWRMRRANTYSINESACSLSPVLLTLVRTPCGRRELWVSLIGCGLPTRSNRPAAAAQVRRMKQATVEVKSPTSMV